MIIKSLFKDLFLFSLFKYYKFKGNNDEFHIQLTLNTLKKFEINEELQLTKEFNVLGLKSKGNYLKSTAYYYSNLNNFKSFKSIIFKDIPIINNINQAFYLYEFSKFKNIKTNSIDLDYNSFSAHKRLLVELLLFKQGKLTEEFILTSITKDFDTKLELFIKKNSFENNKNNGSSHEFGYWLNFILDFYQLTNNSYTKNKLNTIFEKLNKIFISKKVYYHDVLGKQKTIINVSGLLLISKAMLRYSILINDYRFANDAFHIIDIIKKLQLNNNGFLQNTFPIYKGNSKFKFPSWVLNYFLEVLRLKKTVLNEIENSISN